MIDVFPCPKVGSQIATYTPEEFLTTLIDPSELASIMQCYAIKRVTAYV